MKKMTAILTAAVLWAALCPVSAAEQGTDSVRFPLHETENKDAAQLLCVFASAPYALTYDADSETAFFSPESDGRYTVCLLGMAEDSAAMTGYTVTASEGAVSVTQHEELQIGSDLLEAMSHRHEDALADRTATLTSRLMWRYIDELCDAPYSFFSVYAASSGEIRPFWVRNDLLIRSDSENAVSYSEALSGEVIDVGSEQAPRYLTRIWAYWNLDDIQPDTHAVIMQADAGAWTRYDIETADETLRPETLRISGDRLPGDVNLDGTVTRADALMLKQYLQGQAYGAYFCPGNADLNGDGRLDAVDLTLLKRGLTAAESNKSPQ